MLSISRRTLSAWTYRGISDSKVVAECAAWKPVSFCGQGCRPFVGRRAAAPSGRRGCQVEFGEHGAGLVRGALAGDQVVPPGGQGADGTEVTLTAGRRVGSEAEDRSAQHA